MSTFAFTLPVSDSASLRLTLTNEDGTLPNLTTWALTFAAGGVTKTSGAGQITVTAPGNVVTVAILAGNFATVGTFDASLVATSGLSQATWYGTVSVTSAATDGDLTTVAKVRDYMGLGSLDGDTKIAGLIASSSAWVVSQIGHAVLSDVYNETRNGNGTSRMLLRHWPVSAVTSVTIGTDVIPQRTTTDGEGWVLRDDGIDLVGSTFTVGVSNVVIAYVAGYAVCPADLEQAVIEHVALRYRDADRQGITNTAGDGLSVGFSSAGAFAYIQGVLDTYRGVAIG